MRGERRAVEVITALEQNDHVLDELLLDLGCGQGHITQALLAKTSCKIICADISLNLLEVSRTNAPGCEFIQCDGGFLPFRDSVFKTIVSNDVLEHTPYENGVRLVTEARRVTTYNGKVYLSAMNRWEILEPHWLIPFFTWTPRFMWDRFFPLAVRFSPIAKKGPRPNIRYSQHYFPYTRKMMEDLLECSRFVDMTSLYAREKVSDPDYIGSKRTRAVVKFLRSLKLTPLALVLAKKVSVLVFVCVKN